MAFTVNQDMFIIMAHFYIGSQNQDRHPNEEMTYDTFAKLTNWLVQQYMEIGSILKSKREDLTIILIGDTLAHIRNKIEARPNISLGKLSGQADVSYCSAHRKHCI